MIRVKMRIFSAVRPIALCLFLFSPVFAVSQEQGSFRGSIPLDLLRPGRGESPRYPVDMIIGELGRGSASVNAYSFANTIAAGLVTGQMENASLASINPALRESHLTAVSVIGPVSFRIGGGRMEPDGAVSFLVRFIGREQGITGELYIRFISRQVQDSDGEMTTTGHWTFDELLLDEPRDRETEATEAIHRNDFYPYERFF